MSFKALVEVANEVGYHIQKNTDRNARYELFSNEKAPGVITVCQTLRELTDEVAGIYADNKCHG
jgi:hypothetical protein